MRKTTKKGQNRLFDYVGWIGIILLLLNYTLLSIGTIAGQTLLYHSLALVGSLAICIEAWHKRDQQPALLNLIFVGLAIFAVTRLIIQGAPLWW